jgi:hypothetical protein
MIASIRANQLLRCPSWGIDFTLDSISDFLFPAIIYPFPTFTAEDHSLVNDHPASIQQSSRGKHPALHIGLADLLWAGK